MRAEQAEQTRLRIRQAARELFERQGFAETTIAEIAETAGVAVPTVDATYRSKGGLVGAMLEEIEEGAEQAGWEARIRAETDPVRQLHLFVTWIRTLFENGTPVVRAAMEARSAPDVAAMMAQGDGNRLGGATALAAYWEESGALRPGRDATQAAHTLWLLAAAEQFLLATDQLGWSPDRYERWLTTLVDQVIMGADSDRAT